MFTVIFKSWNNNWCEYDTPETYPTLKEAISRANSMFSFECRYIGNNNYINNGLQTWVENQEGKCVYNPNF